jgi:hypothetical protein
MVLRSLIKLKSQDSRGKKQESRRGPGTEKQTSKKQEERSNKEEATNKKEERTNNKQETKREDGGGETKARGASPPRVTERRAVGRRKEIKTAAPQVTVKDPKI